MARAANVRAASRLDRFGRQNQPFRGRIWIENELVDEAFDVELPQDDAVRLAPSSVFPRKSTVLNRHSHGEDLGWIS